MTTLVSLEALAEYMGTTFDPTDVHALRMLETASAIIRGETQEDFELHENDDVFLDGMGRHELLLPGFPVISVTSAAIDGGDPLDPTTYRVTDAGILDLIDGTVWPVGLANVEVEYDHGYETVPEDVQAVCLRIAAYFVENPTAAQVASETLGAYSVSFATRQITYIQPVDGLILAKYKRVWVR